MRFLALALSICLSACGSGTDVGNASVQLLGSTSAPQAALSSTVGTMDVAVLYISQVTFVTAADGQLCSDAISNVDNYHVVAVNTELNLLSETGLTIDVPDLNGDSLVNSSDYAEKLCHFMIYTAPQSTGVTYVNTSLYFEGTTQGGNSFTVSSASRNKFTISAASEDQTIANVMNYQMVFHLGDLISEVDFDSIASGGVVTLTPGAAPSLFENFLEALVADIQGFKVSTQNGRVIFSGDPNTGFDP